jgi:hypothetical protein
MKEGVILDQGTVSELRERLGFDYLLIVELPKQMLLDETSNLSHRFSHRFSRSRTRLSSFKERQTLKDPRSLEHMFPFCQLQEHLPNRFTFKILADHFHNHGNSI